MGKVGIYARFSSMDVLTGEDSMSRLIKNQIEILTKYANENGLEIYKVYADYNKTGTNMNRPELQNLLKDASEGKLDTILVKDLSRFGRNYLEVAQYVDVIFPSFGIRFISVNDNFDSSNYKDDLTIALKSFLNHMYAKDVAKKVRKSFVLRADTEPIVSYKYGYTIKKKNITIDPESSKVVLKIYEMASEGVKIRDIIKYLEDNKILTPIAYRNQRTGHEYDIDMQYKWNYSSVTKLLNDTAYVGEFVNFKERKGLKCSTERNIVVPFPAIVSKELFDSIPKSFGRNHINDLVREKHLSGIIRCQYCKERIDKGETRKSSSMFAPRPYKDKVTYYCNACSHSLPANEFNERVYKELIKAINNIKSNIDGYIENLSTEMELDDKPKMSPDEIHEKMRSLFEEYMCGKIKQELYVKKQNELSTMLLNNEMQKGFNTRQLTSYDLRNRVLRYLNSIDYKEEDHLKFVRENVREVLYSKHKDTITFIFPFME